MFILYLFLSIYSIISNLWWLSGKLRHTANMFCKHLTIGNKEMMAEELQRKFSTAAQYQQGANVNEEQCSLTLGFYHTGLGSCRD